MKPLKLRYQITTGLLSATLLTGLLTGAALAATKGPMMPMGTKDTMTVSTADQGTFITLWKKAFAAGMFTPEQTRSLASELATASAKLSENYKGLNDLLQQKNAVTSGDTATIQKRIDLKEAERDLIISQTKVKLEEFLNKDQVNLVLMAGFHGASINFSGEEHLNNMHSEMPQQMKSVEELSMTLAQSAEKMNQNCQAVSLELIRTNLNTQ